MAEPYKFPDEVEDKKTADVEFEIEGEGEIEIEIEDDTPERDRGRKPLDREVLDPTDERLRMDYPRHSQSEQSRRIDAAIR